MFPYVCLATMPLFCEENWPRKVKFYFSKKESAQPIPSTSCIYTKAYVKEHRYLHLQSNITWKHKFVVALLICHCGLQAFLPYSHFITKVSKLIKS